jgi:heat shock protein HslJ
MMKKLSALVVVVLLAGLLVACAGTPAPAGPSPTAPPAATAVGPVGASITDVVWQWQELIEASPAGQSVVPNPDAYALVFRPNGTYYLQADCNSGSGTYGLEGDRLALDLGGLTMAVCPPESLHDLYLQKLGQVDRYAVEDGRLALILAKDAGRMLFGNAGPAQQAAGSGPAIDPASVSLDTEALGYTYQVDLVPASPYDESQPPGPQGLPEHIQIHLAAREPASGSEPVIYIIPVAAYEGMWESNANSAVTHALEHLGALLDSRPIPVPPFGLPALPFEEIGAGANDLAVQGKYLDLAAGSGLRYVGRFSQDANPVTNADLRYIFQGFSDDGQYLIAFYQPVTSAALPGPDEVSAQERERASADLEGYLEEKSAALDALGPADWEPDLSALDAMIASLRFAAPATGGAAQLLDTTWQWAGLLEMGAAGAAGAPDASAPAAVAPETGAYTLVFRPEGGLQIKADCNVGTGTYALDGPRLTLQRGAMTEAYCGEASLDGQFLTLLAGVTAYKIEDGWLVLSLGDGPDRMIFSHGGPAD